MKTTKTKTILTLSVSILPGLAAPSRVSAFKIDFLTTFVPLVNIPHVGQPVSPRGDPNH